MKVLSIQEVSVQMGISQLSETAANIMKSYQNHLRETLGEAKYANLNLSRAVYPCASVLAASKLRSEKIDLVKLSDLSKSKKKDLLDIVDEMIKLQPKSEKTGAKRNLDLMDKIMGASMAEEKENSENTVSLTKREKIQEDDFEDDGFEDWKQAMFKKAVDNGFTEYKKYLKATN